MTAVQIKNRINELCSVVTFDYNGKSCGIDPLSNDNFDMWYGDKAKTAVSIDDVMNDRFFDGKSLTEIADKITDIDI